MYQAQITRIRWTKTDAKTRYIYKDAMLSNSFMNHWNFYKNWVFPKPWEEFLVYSKQIGRHKTDISTLKKFFDSSLTIEMIFNDLHVFNRYFIEHLSIFLCSLSFKTPEKFLNYHENMTTIGKWYFFIFQTWAICKSLKMIFCFFFTWEEECCNSSAYRQLDFLNQSGKKIKLCELYGFYSYHWQHKVLV